jgi:Domain of unknown function (DUF1731)
MGTPALRQEPGYLRNELPAGAGCPGDRGSQRSLAKSRRVVPGRLLAAGFEFGYSEWARTARDLVLRTRGDSQRID